jgi:hypothetical protein
MSQRKKKSKEIFISLLISQKRQHSSLTETKNKTGQNLQVAIKQHFREI